MGGDPMTIDAIETRDTAGGKRVLTTNAKHLSEKAKTRPLRSPFS
ncbi:hypothetical protein SAMN06265373_106106 [Shimia sagamensis]|uniref:Uncharacterized protein n=1 Tax=Shimia sagamensis TaxID=1566352 RepID=A0ABY1P8M5_9RHOB|nr:hypothetical protein SAMN06265373_106106 [Shimia sagamensis]